MIGANIARNRAKLREHPVQAMFSVFPQCVAGGSELSLPGNLRSPR